MSLLHSKTERERQHPNIEQILVASTGHLSLADAELLDRAARLDGDSPSQQRLPRVSSHQYGWTLYAGQSEPEEAAERVAALRRAGASSTLCALYANACTRGVTALHFDRDAEPVPGYSLHEAEEIKLAPLVVIEVDGGVVSNVWAEDPNVHIIVRDLDNIRAGDADVAETAPGVRDLIEDETRRVW